MQARLENPIWSALTSAQAHLAHPVGAALRFESDVAPFCAVAAEGVPMTADELAALPGDYFFLGAMPALPIGWQLQPISPVMQMVYQGGAVQAPSDAAIRVLVADDPAMQELTAIAFPGYFRARTGILGQYVGVHEQGRLVSMSGERMDLGDLREVSAVCTHPDFAGRGLARLLVLRCMHDMQQQGVRPILHVGSANKRAQALYESLGFAATRLLPHARLTAPGIVSAV